MKNLPIFYQGDDIDISLSIGEEQVDIVINGIDGIEFDDAFADEFGINIDIVSVEGKILINNIEQPNLPTISATNSLATLAISHSDTKDFEKGLLEIELLFIINDSTLKHRVKKIALCWIEAAYVAGL